MKIKAGENRRTLRKTCPNSNLSTMNATWNVQGANSGSQQWRVSSLATWHVAGRFSTSSSSSNLVSPTVQESSFGQKPPSQSFYVPSTTISINLIPLFLDSLHNLFFPSVPRLTSWSFPFQSIYQCLSWHPSSIRKVQKCY